MAFIFGLHTRELDEPYAKEFVLASYNLIIHSHNTRKFIESVGWLRKISNPTLFSCQNINVKLLSKCREKNTLLNFNQPQFLPHEYFGHRSVEYATHPIPVFPLGHHPSGKPYNFQPLFFRSCGMRAIAVVFL